MIKFANRFQHQILAFISLFYSLSLLDSHNIASSFLHLTDLATSRAQPVNSTKFSSQPRNYSQSHSIDKLKHSAMPYSAISFGSAFVFTILIHRRCRSSLKITFIMFVRFWTFRIAELIRKFGNELLAFYRLFRLALKDYPLVC